MSASTRMDGKPVDTSEDTSPSSDQDLSRSLLAGSGLFDEAHYKSQAGWAAHDDPIGHYLSTGWSAGLEPNATFPGSILLPYFRVIGLEGPPAVSWTILRSVGWPLPATKEELTWLAARIRESGVFDEPFYAKEVGGFAAGIDPAAHYVILGEHLGMTPSPMFNPAYYGERYPDVVNAGFSCLRHYVEYGRAEGRAGRPPWICTEGEVKADANKENIILVVHETSRTGAPILGWNLALELVKKYNLFVVRLGDGDLLQDFAALSVEMHGPVKGLTRDGVDMKYALDRWLHSHPFRYAIVNSAESRQMVELLIRRHIPTILLMHEFGSYVNPVHSLRTALDWSSAIVFPSLIVAHAAEEVHPVLPARSFHILPQGMSVLPKPVAVEKEEGTPKELELLTRRHDHEGVFIVLGAGFVQIRKGVDLFLAAAAGVARSNPKRPIHFLWVGHGYHPKEDMAYSVYLNEQLNRSSLNAQVTFLEAVRDLEPVYRIADAFFLSSRLDPMPNVSIDTAMRGIPIICFKEASGTAELLLTTPETAIGVVEHMDAEAAAKVILELASDDALLKRTGEATRNLAQVSFDMSAYVAELDRIGMAAADRMPQHLADVDTLVVDATFDQDMFLGTSAVIESRQDTVIRYLAIANARGWNDPPVPDTTLRRPAAAFNPRIYAEMNADRLHGGVDPLADFIRQGQPAGPWQATVLRPPEMFEDALPSGKLKTALHAHFFYTDLAADFCHRLKKNKLTVDLLISTDTDAKAEELKRTLSSYTGGSLLVRVMPNRGRDIGPLLTGFAEQLAGYDLIGHLHAKRSLFDGSGVMGDQWREFLWQNLLGGHYPMLDGIIAAFEKRDDLGLVFACDPHLIGWDGNRKRALEIAKRLGFHGALPNHFDFPLGTMFWMRREALQPLLNLRLGWNDYPEEPLENDGTILHALERVTPLSNHLAGFQYAVTHINGVSW